MNIKPVVATKKFVAKHKVALAVTATATICIAVQIKAANNWNNFLRAEGLFDKFYATTEI